MLMENNIPPSFIFKDKFFKKLLKSFQNEISKENFKDFKQRKLNK